MVIINTGAYPGMRKGFLVKGKLRTDSSGVGVITLNGGVNYASKITGIDLTAVAPSAELETPAVKVYSGYIMSIVYTSPNTVITVQVNKIITSGAGTTDISAYEGFCHFSFWVNEDTLPSDESSDDLSNLNI